jgi:3-oxoacyl-[acyl-carrier protein] reductase
MYEKTLKQKQGAANGPEKAAALVAYLMANASGQVTGKLISAIWDPWSEFNELTPEFHQSDVYTLRRIVPEDRPKLAPR